MRNNRMILLVVSSLFIVSACANSTPVSSSNLDPSTSDSWFVPSTSSVEPVSKLEEKKIKAYRLFNREDNHLDPDISQDKYKLGEVSLSFVKGEYFIPYITLDNLADLYGRFYLDKEKTKNNVSSSEGKYTWSVNKDNNEVFSSTIDTSNKTFTYSGSLEGLIEGKKDYSKYSFNIRTTSSTTTIDLPDKHAPSISYGETEFEVINENNKAYFPFSMVHTLYHELTGHDFFFNYVNLYEYNEVTDLSLADIIDGDDVYKVFDQMTNYINNNIKEKDASTQPLMPLYLRKYHRSEFILNMNHYYGLQKTWKVSSMLDYYKLYGLYDKFIDDDSAVRGAAYSEAFFMLSDGHTGRTILGDDAWGESNGSTKVQGATTSTFTTERTLVYNALNDQREKFLKANGFEDGIKDALIYSSDGKTAYFGFDSFDAYDKAFNDDGTPKSDDKLAKYDSFFYFTEKLKEIKNHGGVENVIIDDSLNGGGYVWIMGRLLALLSKDNKGTINLLNDLTNVVTKNTFSVDTNNDGKYDEKDCYGNTFKFYILTSPKSFSCGNAFPILAQNQCGVKIIGVKSGGGECVVGENYLSNGIGFAHSSNDHLIILNETDKTYIGVENGVDVNATIKYNSFYDMEEMIKAINSIIN